MKSMLTLLALSAVGCAAVPQAKVPKVEGRTESNATLRSVVPPHSVTTVVHQEQVPALNLAQPATVAKPLSAEAVPVSVVEGLSLSVVEELAVANHPAIGQATADLRSLHGKWVQAGLCPNPTIGYIASEIGAADSPGQQGGYAGQEFVTAQKLQRNRAIVCAEIKVAEQRLAAMIQRVQTDARLRFYNALLAQQRVELAKDLVELATKAAQTSQSLLEAKEIPLAGLLQTEVQLQNAHLLLRTSKNGLNQTWRQLQTLLGDDFFARQELIGDVRSLPVILDYRDQLARVQAASPELATAMADVERSRRVLDRACVEAVPNVRAQVSVQYDNTTSETLTGVQVGIPLPLWNRNQGNICKARAEITSASRNVERVERSLQLRLTDAFRQYADAQATVETYAEEILTRAERTLGLVQQGYVQGEVGYLDLLTAQRTFSQTHLAYLDALGHLWQSYLRIDGLLLEGSLETTVQ